MLNPDSRRLAEEAGVHLRPLQAEAIDAALMGRDALVVMPTGGGKSLCYQLPAMALAGAGAGPTLVVSPLLALMRDQVRQATARGLRAVHVASDQSLSEQRENLAAAPGMDLLFVSPERVTSRGFRAWLDTHRIARVAVDEAHCISEWGHDFRDEYRALGFLRTELGIPVCALTATATARVRTDIVTSLGLIDPVLLVGSLRRGNLALSVEQPTGPGARLARAAALVETTLQGRVVVYAPTRARVKALAGAFRERGIAVTFTHAGRTMGARARAEECFVEGDGRVLVATSAFGMGVDLPDIRLVVFVGAPTSLEAWWQQAGRAGRDGNPARAVLLWSAGDAVALRRLIGDSPSLRAGFQALQCLVFDPACRSRVADRWFGMADEGPCGICDVCVGPDAVAAGVASGRAHLRRQAEKGESARESAAGVVLDAEQEALILRFVSELKRPMGRTPVAEALRGSKAKTIRRRGLGANSGFGGLRGVPAVAILRSIDAMLVDGRLVKKGKKYPTVWLAEKRVRSLTPRVRPRETGLGAALRAWRHAEARRRRWKPYQIFPDAVLKALVAERPNDEAGIAGLRGMGATRASRWAASLLLLLSQHQA